VNTCVVKKYDIKYSDMEYFNKNVDFSGENLRNIDTKIAQRK